jgi:hypothetical protein
VVWLFGCLVVWFLVLGSWFFGSWFFGWGWGWWDRLPACRALSDSLEALEALEAYPTSATP